MNKEIVGITLVKVLVMVELSAMITMELMVDIITRTLMDLRIIITVLLVKAPSHHRPHVSRFDVVDG